MNPTRLAFIRSTLCRHFRCISCRQIILFLFHLLCILVCWINFVLLSKDPSSARPFEGLRLIDVGCGGGLLSEVYTWSDLVVRYKEDVVITSGLFFFFFCLKPLARMGATVTGVDAVDKNIKIARLHAVKSLT